MKFRLLSFLIIIILSSCENDDSQQIIDRAIEAHGGKLFENVHIEFDFRNRHYTSHRRGGIYTYTREFRDSTGQVKDILTNNNFQREINGEPANITDERAKAFSNSVNSVIYFALLPYGLNDPAVRKKYVGETELNGKTYHVIQITFEEEGGGKDHEDVFLYWIEKETYTMDYLAYTYESDGGGIRFREALSRRKVDGILFQDYINYEPADKNTPLDKMESLYKNGELKKLSNIVVENISVKLLSDK